jgi:hypothetical protein
MQQKSGHDLWPLFVSIGLVLKGLALRRVQPDMSVNNHSGYSRVHVSANRTLAPIISEFRVCYIQVGHCGADLVNHFLGHAFLPLLEPLSLSHQGRPGFKWRSPDVQISHRGMTKAYPPLPPITARTVSSGPKSSVPST